MATDRQLSANFWLHEFPCWSRASEDDVARLKETVQRVLQPFRSHVGVPVVPTSWKWWTAGCTPRTGAHAGGGTVDFDAPDLDDGQLREAHDWGTRYLLPAGYLGRWIYEPLWIDDAGNKVQGRHIHAAPRDDMLAANLPGDVGAYIEGPPGTYTPSAGSPTWGGHSGGYGDPIPIEGITATVGPRWGAWLLLGAVAGTLLQDRARYRGRG